MTTAVSRVAIRNWRLLLLGVVGLLAIAWMAWSKIPRLEDPAVEAPVVFVSIPYPGASPEDLETQVMKPVEEDLFGLEGVTQVDSSAYPDFCVIKVLFEDDTAMDAAADNVRTKVLAARAKLPSTVGDPTITRAKTSTYTAQLVVVVSGNRADSVLTERAKQLKDALVATAGVGSVTLRGERRRAVRVRLDPAKLASHKLSVESVATRIRLANVNVPSGALRAGDTLTLLSVQNQLASAADVAKVAVGTGPAGPIALGDVADVRLDYTTATEHVIQEGVPGVALEVRFRAGENAVAVGTAVRATLEKARASLEPGLALTIAHDQPASVHAALGSLVESLVEGVVLVMIIITLGMGWRAALVVSMVVPLAIAGAVFGLYALGFALEQVSIAGLIVALGLLVDDAVVVTESVQLLRDRGLGASRAAILGTARVFWANNGTTAVACASFLPLFFMGGAVGAFIRGLPTAVILALVTSLFVAQLVTPWLATLVLRPAPNVTPIADDAPFDRKDDSQHEERNVALQAIRRLYTRLTPWVIAHPGRVLGLTGVMLLAACALFPLVGAQFFPKADKPVLFVTVDLPRGTDLAVTTRKTAEVAALVRTDPSVRATSALAGGAYPPVFLGRAQRPSGPERGDILVQLTEASSASIASRLRRRLSAIAGAHIHVVELYHGPSVPHPVVVRLEGEDYAVLRARAAEVKAILRDVPGTLDVSDTISESIPVTKVLVDGPNALRAGITPAAIGTTLRTIYGEDKVTSYREGTEMVDVLVENASHASSIDDVGQIPLVTPSGATVPVMAVSAIGSQRGYAELQHRNTHRVVEVSADVDGKALPSKIIAAARPKLEAIAWEPGTSYAFAGERTETQKSFRNLSIAATGTVLVIFVLLVLMFGSLRRAVLVLVAVPFVLIGALPGLLLTGNAFGFMAFLGLIALIGVYVNHKIYFVDRMQELVARGMDWREAIHQAGIDRLRPVVLTALTAILGLLPLTLFGGNFWSAFGWVNVFGLASSIPLSLVVLPALLSIAFRSEKLRGLFIERRRTASRKGWLAALAVLLVSTTAYAQDPVNVDPLTPVRGGITADKVAARAALASHSVEAAVHLAEAASARTAQAEAGYYPRVNATARYTRLSDFTPPPLIPLAGQLVGTSAPAGTLNPSPTVAVGVTTSIQQILDQYLAQATVLIPVTDYISKVAPSVDAAGAREDAADADVEAARGRALADAKLAYYDWIRARGAVVVTDLALTSARLHVKDAERQFQTGAVYKADVLRARTAASAAELALERAKNATALAEKALRLLIDAKDSETLAPGEALEAPLPAPGAMSSLIAEAKKRRPELHSLAHNVEATRKQSAVARAGAYPSVGLFGEVTEANPNPRRFPETAEWFATWSVGVQATWTPTEIPSALASAKDYEARAAAIEAQLKGASDAIELETTQAFYAVREADAALSSSARELESATENSRVTRELFNAGKGAGITIIDAESALTQARFENMNARVASRVARVRLDYAVGRDVKVARADRGDDR